MRRYILLVIAIISIHIQPVSAAVIEIPDKIRVIIADDVPEIVVSIRGDYFLTTVETDEVLKSARTSFNVRIRPTDYGIMFGNEHLKIPSIQITPQNEPSIYLGKRLYRGNLQVLRTKNGLLRAINVVDLDDYVNGVLYHEVSHRWPIEAIKAQAIASRTFAIYQAQENRRGYYYLKADVSSQVYGGVYAEKYRTQKAVEETKGQVLVYNAKILPAFFHATCGGKTEDAGMLWNVSLAPLKGVSCAYCKNSPHFNWSYSIGLSDIRVRLKKAGYNVSDIYSIKIKSRDPSGRVTLLQFVSQPSSVEISAKDFRSMIGHSVIKSTNFVLEIQDGIVYFNGKGWGHGVGMCQWGAFAMAKKGKTAQEIVTHYYPGSKVVRLADR